ncbi:hypothetical protein RMATCC62417_18353 [Rhizopus microsporus]|nr:hypothetical protein RMATCC62417_18353 [Rhizopus microsporus]
MGFEAMKRYLQAQSIMHASTYAMLVTVPFSFMLNYLCVYPFGLGFIGAPIATSASYWLMFLVLLEYIRYVQAFSGIIIICAEWSAFEISSLAASYLSTTHLAAQSILLTLSSATYTVPLGISTATSNRVGHALGASDGHGARTAAIAALLFAISFGCINSLFYLCTHSYIGRLFSSDPDVVDLVSHVLPLCAVFQIADGVAGTGGGVIRGLGRQSVAACINIIVYYLVALPIGFYLTFRLHWSLIGLWIGLTTALFLVASIEVIFLFNVDWFNEVKQTQERMRRKN